MSEEVKTDVGSSPEEGSSADDLIKSGPSANIDTGNEGKPTVSSEAGEEKVNLDDYVAKQTYEDLESKMGTMGEELGNYREFVKEFQPLLDEFEKQPELVDLIMSGKIDSELANAVAEGKVKIEDATVIASAHEKVKEEMGKNKYEKTSPEDIEKLISEKANELFEKESSKIRGDVNTLKDEIAFKDKLNKFIEDTPDFPEFSTAINEYIRQHPNVDDLEVAYHAVKGIHYEEMIKKKAEDDAAEEEKNRALNATGGGSQGGTIPSGKSAGIDDLVSGKGNPNVF